MDLSLPYSHSDHELLIPKEGEDASIRFCGPELAVPSKLHGGFAAEQRHAHGAERGREAPEAKWG